MNDDRPLMPGDRVFVRASFTRIFPWDGTADEFLDELEADTVAGFLETGYQVNLEDRVVVLVDDGLVNETYHGAVTLRVEAVPADENGEPITHQAGIPLLAVLGAVIFALGAALGFGISYTVLDVEVLEAAGDTLDDLGGAVIETRKLVVTAAAAAGLLFVLFKYSP